MMLMLTMCAGTAQAQNTDSQKDEKKSWDVIPYIATNIGMTTSLGTPAETREICSAKYNMNFAVGVVANKHITEKWGVHTGLSLERKGSNSNVIMQDYFTRIRFEGQDGETQGYYSGRSEAWHDVYYLTVPVNAMYHLAENTELHFGPYFAYAVSRKRTGLSTEGTIRQSLLAPVIPVEHSEDDTSNRIARFDWGLQVGMTRQFIKGWYSVIDLSCGLKNTWDGRDYGMTKAILNIYAKLGIGYKFSL